MHNRFLKGPPQGYIEMVIFRAEIHALDEEI